VLFRAGIRPSRPGNKITRSEAETLVSRVKEILEEAILAGGSSISDYVQADGGQGEFQTKFRVYGREKQACVVCRQQIRRTVQAGRSTFFCSKCQR
jgi:formamidopyrimidine-DNA glycosylase